MKFRSPRGTHDILPDQVVTFRKVMETSRRLFERCGYREIVTPVFEENDLFARSVGSDTDIVQKEMYVFNDRAGRTLALRPEGTASVIRSYLQHGLHGRSDVQKLYYTGPMFRYDRPAAGRYRQFYQVGIEAIGSLSPYFDVECIAVLRDLAILLGINDVEILINSVGCKRCRPSYIVALKEFLSSGLSSMCSDCQTRFETNPLRMLDCKKEGWSKLLKGMPMIHNHLCEECSTHFDEVKSILTSAQIPFIHDPQLVRGLDYYTKTAFELIDNSLGVQSSLGGGGRYDDLVEVLGGAPTPAVGFSAGVERLIIAHETNMKASQSETSRGARVVEVFFVATDDTTREAAFNELLKARKSLSVDMDFTGKSVKAQFRKADRLGAGMVVIFGSEEMKDGKVRVKNMESGDETDIPLSELVDHLVTTKDGLL